MALEAETREWVEAVVGEKLGECPLQEELKDGIVLCLLANKLKPGVCPKPSTSKMPFKQMENVAAYLKACVELGVRPFEMFQTVDLFENKNFGAVLTNLQSVGRVAQSLPGYSGPVFGAKMATATPREFSEAQLAEARAAAPFLNQGSRSSFAVPTSGRPSCASLERSSSASLAEATPGPAAAPKPEPAPSLEPEPTATLGSIATPEPPPPRQPPASVSAEAMTPLETSVPPNTPVQEAVAPGGAEASATTGAASAASGVAELELESSRALEGSVEEATRACEPAAGSNRSMRSSRARRHVYLPAPAPSATSPPPPTLGPSRPARPSRLPGVEAVVGEKLGECPLQEELKDGIVLCLLANKLKPGVCPKPSTSKMPFKQMENVAAYLKACVELGVRPFEMFQTVDLFENKNFGAVLTNLQSVGRVAQSLPGYSGPVFGAKMATATPREFSEAQVKHALGSTTTRGRLLTPPRAQLIEAKGTATFLGKGSHGGATPGVATTGHK